MKKQILLFLLTLNTLSAQEARQGHIDSVALFKNGLVIVRMSDLIPESGKLEMNELLEPVHGSFWVDSEKPVTAKVEMRESEGPLSTVSQAELLRNLSGKKVTLHLSEDSIAGEIVGETPEQRTEWGRDYAAMNGQPGRSSYLSAGGTPVTSSPGVGEMVFLKTEDGKILAISPGQIQRVAFAEVPKIRRKRPVLTLSSTGAGKIAVQYLTRGLSWAPSYRIDLTEPKRLSIIQGAAIRNELSDLKEVEIRLISGFPSVRFGAVDSPLSARSTWETFFAGLSRSAGAGGGLSNGFDNGIAQQGIVIGNILSGQGLAGIGPADEGESVDLHYQSIGKHSLAAGEALSVEVAKAGADYERVVQWEIPDTRAPNGRYIEEYERQRSPEKFDDKPWDAIVFKNPFTFPMTTAPAMLVDKGDFQGQQISTWTNPGAETSIRITKALSIATRSVENEIPDSRVNLNIAGNDYYKVQVQGELSVKNHRGTPAVLAISRSFSGELREADDEPQSQLLETGVYSINKRNELKWRIDLKQGQEKTIRYRYEVLVDN